MKLLVSLAAATLLSTGALAADLPVQRSPIAPVAVVPAFTWTGFYVGVNAGFGFNNGRPSFTPNSFPEVITVYSGDGDDMGFTGGAQAGFNWQMGSLVLGLEADINYLDRSGDGGGVPANPLLPYAVVGSNHSDWFATIRPRVGFALDRLMIYATGGLAFTTRDDDAVLLVNNPGAPLPCAAGCAFTSHDDGFQFGWTVGAGVEYAVTNAVSVKLEYLHVNLGDNDRVYRAPFAGARQHFVARGDDSFDVVRAGLNVRF